MKSAFDACQLVLSADRCVLWLNDSSMIPPRSVE